MSYTNFFTLVILLIVYGSIPLGNSNRNIEKYIIVNINTRTCNPCEIELKKYLSFANRNDIMLYAIVAIDTLNGDFAYNKYMSSIKYNYCDSIIVYLDQDFDNLITQLCFLKNLDSNITKSFLSEPSPSVFFINNGDIKYFSVSELVESLEISESYKMYFRKFVGSANYLGD